MVVEAEAEPFTQEDLNHQEEMVEEEMAEVKVEPANLETMEKAEAAEAAALIMVKEELVVKE
jgi:hypothetical protein